MPVCLCARARACEYDGLAYSKNTFLLFLRGAISFLLGLTFFQREVNNFDRDVSPESAPVPVK